VIHNYYRGCATVGVQSCSTGCAAVSTGCAAVGIHGVITLAVLLWGFMVLLHWMCYCRDS